jgi:hypothetical protein
MRTDQPSDGAHTTDALYAYRIEAAIARCDRLLRDDPTLSAEARRSYEAERAEAVEVLAAIKQRGNANA